MIDITSEDGKTIRVNKAYKDITGFNEDDLERSGIMEFVYPDNKMRKKAWRSIEQADGTFKEFTTVTKSGEKRIQRWANIRISDGSTIGIGIDVTEQKELERKHEQDRLELQKVYNNIPILINLHNEKEKVYRINNFFEERAGYSNEDLREIDLIDTMIPDEDKEKAAQHMLKADGSWEDFRIITKSGEIINTSWSNIKVTDDLSIGIGIDTTDLKQKERKLQELTNQYRNAEKLANFGHWKRDLITNESVVSDGFYEIVEVDPSEQEFNFDFLKRVIHPDDFDFFLKAVERSYSTGTLDIHYRIIKQKSGDVAHIHELGRVDVDENGEPYFISGTVQDITETVEYQTQLQELAERYRKAEEIADIGHWWRDLKNDTAVFSQGYYDIVGLKKGQRDSSFDTSVNLIHPEDRENYRKAFKEALETGSLNVRFRIIKPGTGEVGYFQELAETEYNAEGDPVSISGTIQDTTQREEFQIALSQRNKFIEATLENLPIGVAVNLIETGEVTIMNKKFAEIYGWPKDVLTDLDTFFKKYTRTMNTGNA